MQLTKLNQIGQKGAHLFKDSAGNFETVFCLIEDYNNLGSGNQPLKEGFSWVHSSLVGQYDSLSGNIEDGTYMELDESFLVKIEDKDIFYVSKDKVISDILAEDVLSEVQNEITINTSKIYGYSL